MSGATVDDAAFAAALDRLGPFERPPIVAVAVSGGSDSMALTLLASRWVRARGGRIVALTVDHRLRPESGDEAAALGRRLARLGIEHAVLPWADPVPVHAAARAARYALLEAECRRRGVLHLLLGHTADDQAETVLLRLARGSGVDGLAGIPAVRETAELRLLRPLLGFGRAALRAWLAAAGETWVDDPSNDDPRFARGRLRAVSDLLAAEGLTPAALAATARRAGRARAALEGAAAALAARAAVVAPEGFVTIDRRALAESPEEPALRVLARAIAAVGGAEHPTRLERLERLFAALRTDGLAGGRTLGGCRVVPSGAGAALVLREPSRPAARLPVTSAEVPLWWDRRFRVRLDGLPGGVAPGDEIRPLGAEGVGSARRLGAPAAALRALPGLWRGNRLHAVPDLLARRAGGPPGSRVFQAVFAPGEPLSGPPFGVV